MPIKQVSTLTPGQGGFLQQLMEMLSGSGLGGAESAMQYFMDLLSGSPESYQKFEAPMMRQFNEQIVPGIAEKFTGAGGGQRSSAFTQALGGAGAGLQEQLAAMRGGLQQQGAQGLMSGLQGLGSLGLGTRAFENVYEPKRPGFLQQLLGGLGGAAGTGLGLSMGMGGLGGLGPLLGMLGSLGQKRAPMSQNTAEQYFQLR